jgi:hypothetical protein
VGRVLRRVGAVLGALAAVWGQAPPAEALTYGGWNARLTFDTWRDDNLARGLAVSTDVLPYGNEDLGGRVGLTIGNVLVLTPDIDMWVLTGVSGTRGMNYPDLGALWGSLFVNTVWHLEGGREAFALVGTTKYFGTGTYYAGELGVAQPLWPGATARVEIGSGRFAGEVAGTDFALPSVGGGVEQWFPTGTSVGVRYALQAQTTDTGSAPRHQIYALASQRLGWGFEVHAHYLETIDQSETAGYRGGYADLGVAYEF